MTGAGGEGYGGGSPGKEGGFFTKLRQSRCSRRRPSSSSSRDPDFPTGGRSPVPPGVAPRPRTPPASFPSAAAAPSAGGSEASPRPRLSPSSSAPAVNPPPSIAHSVLPATRQATVGSSPPLGSGRSSPACASTNTPVP